MQGKNRKENRKEKPGIALINSEEYIIHYNEKRGERKKGNK